MGNMKDLAIDIENGEYDKLFDSICQACNVKKMCDQTHREKTSCTRCIQAAMEDSYNRRR